jgi:hypothetical protein
MTTSAQVDQVVAVHVGHEQGVELVHRDARVGQPEHGRASGVELQRDVAVAHERAGPCSPRRRVRHAGAGERDGRRGHDGRLLAQVSSVSR